MNPRPEIDKIISKTNYVTFPHSTAFAAEMSRGRSWRALRLSPVVEAVDVLAHLVEQPFALQEIIERLLQQGAIFLANARFAD